MGIHFSEETALIGAHGTGMDGRNPFRTAIQGIHDGGPGQRDHSQFFQVLGDGHLISLDIGNDLGFLCRCRVFLLRSATACQCEGRDQSRHGYGSRDFFPNRHLRSLPSYTTV